MNPNDLRALALINDGTLTTNRETGEVWFKGRLARTSTDGYVHINGLRAHRVVWLDAHGFIADGYEINHRNRKRDDNRIINLEVVTRSQNIRHAKGHLGYVGVRPEDVANASPEFIADLAKRLDIDYIDDPDLMAWALQNADSTETNPPERESSSDEVLLRAADGDWATRLINGVVDRRNYLSRSA